MKPEQGNVRYDWQKYRNENNMDQELSWRRPDPDLHINTALGNYIKLGFESRCELEPLHSTA